MVGIESFGQTSISCLCRPAYACHEPGRIAAAEKQRTEIDAGLLEELRDRARKQHRTEGELLEEVVRSYLVLAPRRSGSLDEFFERLEHRRRDDGAEPLPEDEATSLANEELHAMRRARREAP